MQKLSLGCKINTICVSHCGSKAQSNMLLILDVFSCSCLGLLGGVGPRPCRHPLGSANRATGRFAPSPSSPSASVLSCATSPACALPLRRASFLRTSYHLGSCLRPERRVPILGIGGHGWRHGNPNVRILAVLVIRGRGDESPFKMKMGRYWLTQTLTHGIQ